MNPPAPPRRLHIKTWGCQMNVYDSDRMAELLAPLGYAPTDTPEAADLIILNTCHIREKASEKLFSELGRLHLMQQVRRAAGQDLWLCVAGCVAQAEGQEIIARAPYVQLVVGSQAYHQLPEMIARLHRGAGAVLNTDFPAISKFDALPPARQSTSPSAFLAIQEGCDKFCTFCVVPYTRGAEYSRPVAALVAEAEQLLAAGAQEIVLLGQNVNAYHGLGPDGQVWNLARLLTRLAELPVARLRYTTSHPRDMDADLIAAHRDLPTLMPLLHLPVQSGSDRVLAAMNRRHTIDAYQATIAALRAARADIAFSSDFIVGFPGETDADFAATLALVRAVGFAQAYSFAYSVRPGTPAAAMDGQVPEPVKQERLQELQRLLGEQQTAANRALVGQVVPVLFDRPGKQPGQLLGRSPWLQSVHAPAPARLMGQIHPVHITGATLSSLGGQLMLRDVA